MSEGMGLAGRLIATLSSRRREARARELELLETLTLGPKKQLQLVRCGGMRFLVGSGPEGVQAIVRVDAVSDGETR